LYGGHVKLRLYRPCCVVQGIVMGSLRRVMSAVAWKYAALWEWWRVPWKLCLSIYSEMGVLVAKYAA
ncbi:MAG: hypothetical protein ACKPKO_21900, partial [Candidatus Fonsibacter sp.]